MGLAAGAVLEVSQLWGSLIGTPWGGGRWAGVSVCPCRWEEEECEEGQEKDQEGLVNQPTASRPGRLERKSKQAVPAVARLGFLAPSSPFPCLSRAASPQPLAGAALLSTGVLPWPCWCGASLPWQLLAPMFGRSPW